MLMRVAVFFLLMSFTFLIAQNTKPEVSNVTFSQRTDGSYIIDVYYDLNDIDGDTLSMLMLASADSGSSWNFNCDSLNGDFGCNILSGIGKHIEWDFGAEHVDTYVEQFRVKIYADDRNNEKGKVTDIDGNIYVTTKIGTQWWMAENLKVTRYQNGDSIPNVTTDSTWITLTSGAYCNYDNDTTNVSTYGSLYNWFAAADSRNIAPEGWHVPNDTEWQILVDYLGVYSLAGGKMKSTGTIEGGDGLWYEPNGGATNESGFFALPGGYYRGNPNIPFLNMGNNGYWWSSKEYSSTRAASRSVIYSNSDVYLSSTSKRYGFSVRCVRD